MKYSEQNLAVAKLAGWRYEAPPAGGVSSAHWYHPDIGWRGYLPQYVLEGTSIQNLIDRLIVQNCKEEEYVVILYKVVTGKEWPTSDKTETVDVFKLSQARCDQKAEALLKTFAAWTS